MSPLVGNIQSKQFIDQRSRAGAPRAVEVESHSNGQGGNSWGSAKVLTVDCGDGCTAIDLLRITELYVYNGSIIVCESHTSAKLWAQTATLMAERMSENGCRRTRGAVSRLTDEQG